MFKHNDCNYSNNNGNNNINKKPKKIPDMTKLLGENVEEEEVKVQDRNYLMLNLKKKEIMFKKVNYQIDVTALGQQLAVRMALKTQLKKRQMLLLINYQVL